MYKFAKMAKNKNLKVTSIIAPRHANEIIEKKQNLEILLKKIGPVYKFNKIEEKKIKKILGQNKETLYFSFDSAWIFKENILKNLFKNKLINSHSTRLPLDRGGGGFSWRILNQDKLGICLLHLISNSKIDEGKILFHKNFIFPHSLKKPSEYYSFQLNHEEEFMKEFLNKIINKKDFNLLGQPEY